MWIARDKCGDLYIYEQKPAKDMYEHIWLTDGKMCSLDHDKGFNGFDDIHWEDEEPVEIILKKG